MAAACVCPRLVKPGHGAEGDEPGDGAATDRSPLPYRGAVFAYYNTTEDLQSQLVVANWVP